MKKPASVRTEAGATFTRPINWNNVGDVISLAREVGKGMVVVKHPDRGCYCLMKNTSQHYKPEWVVHRT